MVSLDMERALLPYLRQRRARRVEWRCTLDARGVDTIGLQGGELRVALYRLPDDQDLPALVQGLGKVLGEERQEAVGLNRVVFGSRFDAAVRSTPAGQPPEQMFGAPHVNG